jgi:hypothetical protein
VANKLPEGKKMVVELSNDGYRNVFFKNKWGDFLAGLHKIGLEKGGKLPKGVVAFLVDEGGAVIPTPGAGPVPIFTPVTEQDKARAAELNAQVDVPDTEGLPPFEPFGFEQADPAESDKGV